MGDTHNLRGMKWWVESNLPKKRPWRKRSLKGLHTLTCNSVPVSFAGLLPRVIETFTTSRVRGIGRETPCCWEWLEWMERKWWAMSVPPLLKLQQAQASIAQLQTGFRRAILVMTAVYNESGKSAWMMIYLYLFMNCGPLAVCSIEWMTVFSF